MQPVRFDAVASKLLLADSSTSTNVTCLILRTQSGAFPSWHPTTNRTTLTLSYEGPVSQGLIFPSSSSYSR